MCVACKVEFGEEQTVSMHTVCKRGDDWQLISTGVWTSLGTRKVLQFVTQDLAKQVELKGIRDVVVSTADAPEAEAP